MSEVIAAPGASTIRFTGPSVEFVPSGVNSPLIGEVGTPRVDRFIPKVCSYLIPPLEILRTEISDYGEKVPVMGHEVKHVLGARHFGYNVLDVTSVPGRGFRGLTRLGPVNHEHYGVIAVMGSLDTPFGEAKGFGSDFAQANKAAQQSGKNGIQGFISSARGINRQYPRELQKAMAEIMVYMEQKLGHPVPGFMINDIYNLAESNYNGSDVNHEAHHRVINIDDEQLKEYISRRQAGNETQVINRNNGTTDFVVITEGVITEVTNVCNGCGKHNGAHAAHCPTNISKENTNKIKSKNSIVFPQPFVIGEPFSDELRVAA